MALKTMTLPREFILDGRKLADPNPSLSIEDVRTHYTGIYPALNNASYEEKADRQGANDHLHHVGGT